jgi:hypothetical protein
MLRYRYPKDSPKHEYIIRNYAAVAPSFGTQSKDGSTKTKPPMLVTALARYDGMIALEIRGFRTDQGDDMLGPVGCTAKGASFWKTGILEMKREDKPYQMLAAKIRKIELSKKKEDVKRQMIESLINESRQRRLNKDTDQVSQ